MAVEAQNGMVTSSQAIASQVGVDILKRAATPWTPASPLGWRWRWCTRSGNIGGGGFMMIHTAAGKDTVIDYREGPEGRHPRHVRGA